MMNSKQIVINFSVSFVFFCVVINVTLYALLGPSYEFWFLALGVIFGAIFGGVLIKRSLRSFIIATSCSLAYLMGSLILNSISNNTAYSQWVDVNMRLDYYQEALESVTDKSEDCPSLTDIGVQEGEIRLYRDKDTCVLYALGPDGLDQQANVTLPYSSIDYSSGVAPWNFMFFGKTMLYVLGYSDKLNGDIVRKFKNDANTN